MEEESCSRQRSSWPCSSGSMRSSNGPTVHLKFTHLTVLIGIRNLKRFCLPRIAQPLRGQTSLIPDTDHSSNSYSPRASDLTTSIGCPIFGGQYKSILGWFLNIFIERRVVNGRPVYEIPVRKLSVSRSWIEKRCPLKAWQYFSASAKGTTAERVPSSDSALEF